MTSYIVIKTMDNKKLGRKKLKINGYPMNLKLKPRKDLISVSNFMIVDDNLEKNVLLKQFQLAYRRLFRVIMDVLNDPDATSSDTQIALTEIEKMKQILKDKYEHKFTDLEYKRMVKKVELLEKQLKEKLIFENNMRKMYQKIMDEELEEKKGRGR